MIVGGQAVLVVHSFRHSLQAVRHICIEVSDSDFVLAELMHHVCLPVLEIQFKFVDIVIQLAHLFIKLGHQTFHDASTRLSHHDVKFSLIVDPQLDLILHLHLQFANH